MGLVFFLNILIKLLWGTKSGSILVKNRGVIMSGKMIKGAAATALTVSSLLSSTPVMAKEEVKDTNLQSKVDTASQKVNHTKKELDTALQEKEAVEKEEAKAKEEYNQAQNAYQEQKLKNDQYLEDQLQAKLDVLEKNEANIKAETDKLESLQTKQKQYKSDLQKAQEEKVQLEKELQQLEAQLDSVTPEDLKNAKDAVKQAQKQVDALQADVDAVNQAYTDQKEKVDTLTQAQAQAKKEYDQALAEKNEAQENLNLANARLEQAKKDLESYESDTIKAEAQKAFDEAKKQSDAANGQLESAKQKEAQTKDDLQKVQKQMKDAKSKMDEAQELLTTKQGQLDKKNKEYESLSQNVKKYKETYDQDLEAYNKAEQSVSNKKKEWATCQLNIVSYSSEIADLDDVIQKQQELVNDAQADYNRVTKLTSKDFFAFFEQGDALNAFDQATANTVLGDPDDATSLQNMKIALQELKVLNQIRKNEGVSEVGVTSLLMAQAQIQTNESSHTNKDNNIFYVQENMTWGVHPNESSAYEIWYTQEKELFNDIVNGTPELKALRDKGLRDFQIRDYMSESQLAQVGHYLNTINPNFRLAGSAFNSSKTFTVENVYHDYNWGSDAIFTVDEYEQLLDGYMEANNPETFKANLEKGIQELNKQKKDLASLNQNLAELNAEKTKIEAELSPLQDTAQEAKQKKEASGKVYEKAKQEADGILSQMEAERLSIETLQRQFNQIKEAEYLPAIEQEKMLKKAYEDAKADRLQKEADVKKAQENVQKKEAKLKDITDHFEENATAAKQEVANAKSALEKANQNYDACLKKESQTKKDFDLANQTLQKAQKDLDRCKTEKEAHLQKLNAAQQVLTNAQQKENQIESNLTNFENKKTECANKQDEITHLTQQNQANEDAIAKSQSNLNAMEQIKTRTNAEISDLNEKKEIWQSIVAGGNDVLDDGSEWSQKIETFKELRQIVADKKAAFLEVKDRAVKKRQVYAKAKNEYEEAKKVLDAAEKSLKEYKKEDVDTSVFTDETILLSIGAISLAGFALTFAKSRKEK